jgi:hypothetical protein
MGDNRPIKVINKGGPLGGVLFISWAGALVYFVQHSVGFVGFVLALVKACVWPALVLHKILELLRL